MKNSRWITYSTNITETNSFEGQKWLRISQVLWTPTENCIAVYQAACNLQISSFWAREYRFGWGPLWGFNNMYIYMCIYRERHILTVEPVYYSQNRGDCVLTKTQHIIQKNPKNFTYILLPLYFQSDLRHSFITSEGLALTDFLNEATIGWGELGIGD